MFISIFLGAARNDGMRKDRIILAQDIIRYNVLNNQYFDNKHRHHAGCDIENLLCLAVINLDRFLEADHPWQHTDGDIRPTNMKITKHNIFSLLFISLLLANKATNVFVHFLLINHFAKMSMANFIRREFPQTIVYHDPSPPAWDHAKNASRNLCLGPKGVSHL